MRANEFIRDEEKLDEILPLIGAAAGGIARAAGAVAGRAAAGLGRAAIKGAGALARGAVGAVIGGGDDDDEEPDAGPNATVGVQPTKTAMPATGTTPATGGQANAAMAKTADITNLKPGVSLQMPTNTGRVGNFKVSKVTANDVEIENPDKLKNPNEPDRIVYSKRDLAKVMGTK